MSDHDPILMDGDKKYWYNLKTGLVEYGMISQSVDRVGPFDTTEEAENAPRLLADRAREWATEDAEDEKWGAPKGPHGE